MAIPSKSADAPATGGIMNAADAIAAIAAGIATDAPFPVDGDPITMGPDALGTGLGDGLGVSLLEDGDLNFDDIGAHVIARKEEATTENTDHGDHGVAEDHSHDDGDRDAGDHARADTSGSSYGAEISSAASVVAQAVRAYTLGESGLEGRDFGEAVSHAAVAAALDRADFDPFGDEVPWGDHRTSARGPFSEDVPWDDHRPDGPPAAEAAADRPDEVGAAPDPFGDDVPWDDRRPATPADEEGDGEGSVITGNAGRNTLVGTDGDDTISGLGGVDTLTGGDGEDAFVFSDGDGSDTITDFQAGDDEGDIMDLRGLTRVANFTDVLASAVELETGTMLDFGDGDEVMLLGVDLDSLDEDNFLF